MPTAVMVVRARSNQRAEVGKNRRSTIPGNVNFRSRLLVKMNRRQHSVGGRIPVRQADRQCIRAEYSRLSLAAKRLALTLRTYLS